MRFIFGRFCTILIGIIWFYSYCEFFPITFSIGYYCVQKNLIFICGYFICWTYRILRFNDLLRIILGFLYMWLFCQAQNCLTFLTSSVFFHSFPVLISHSFSYVIDKHGCQQQWGDPQGEGRTSGGVLAECWYHVGSGRHSEDFGVWGIPGGVYLGVTQPSSSVKNLLWGLLRDGHMEAYRLIVYLESTGRRWEMLKCEGEEGSRVTPRF